MRENGFYRLERRGAAGRQVVKASLEFNVVRIAVLRLQGLWSVSVFVCVRSACMCCCHVLRIRIWIQASFSKQETMATGAHQLPMLVAASPRGTQLGMLLPSSGVPDSRVAAASSMVLPELSASVCSSSCGKSNPYVLVSGVSTKSVSNQTDLLILLREDCKVCTTFYTEKC